MFDGHGRFTLVLVDLVGRCLVGVFTLFFTSLPFTSLYKLGQWRRSSGNVINIYVRVLKYMEKCK